MGCGCYAEEGPENKIKNKEKGKITLTSSDKNSVKFNNVNEKDQMNKLSSISSFISDNSQINKKKDAKKNKLTDKKDNNTTLKKYKSACKPNLKRERIICNISLINFNEKEKEKFQIKIDKNDSIKNLIDLIQNEIDKLYNIKGHAILFHKGIKVSEDENINNILNKQNEIINLNLTVGNENNDKKQNIINELNFEVILVPLEDEEILNNEKLLNIKNENGEIINIQEQNYTKKIISYLIPKCNKHKEKKLIYICLTCSNSFCELEYEEHKSQFPEHEIIHKNTIVDLNYEVKSIKHNLKNKYDDLISDMNIEKSGQQKLVDENQLNYISTNNLFSKIKIEIMDIHEKMELLFNSIKDTYQKINLKFLSIYEEKMPQIIEFYEYVDKTLSTIANLNIFSNENMFIENYDNYLNIKKISDKYYNNIIVLKEIIIKYKQFLESFKNKGNNLLDYVKQGIDKIIKIKSVEKLFSSNSTDLFQSYPNDYNLFRSNNFNYNKMSKKNINDISMNTTRELNQSINLKFLFSDKKAKKQETSRRDNTFNLINKGISTSFRPKSIFMKESNKNNLLENEKLVNFNIDNRQIKNINEKTTPKKKYNFGSSNISLNTETNKMSSNISTLRESKINIYSLIYGTNKMIRFVTKLSKLEIISPDISDLKITKFETYISKLNFKYKFYISGGYNTSKIFYEFDSNTNKFIKLPEMLSNHYYHNMIGYKNYIYSISGFKSKKVEKFSLIENKWISLPDLDYERTFPNSLIYNDNLFIFGKINNIKGDPNINIIEYINLKDYIPDENKNWTKIEIKFNFPFNSGIIKLDNTNILVGGKLDINEDCIQTSYNMQIENINNKYEINIKLNDSKLEKPDEFGGNNFYALDEIGEIFGNFSVVNPYLFYIFDKNLNKFINLEYTEQKEEI